MAAAFWDTVAGVVLTMALLATGWVVRQLFLLTAATASLSAMIRELQDDHDDRLERIESHLWGRGAIMGPQSGQMTRPQRRDRQ